MPTLHLIDADSTQACPAVLDIIRRRIQLSHNPDDRLLLLGGGPLVKDALAVGIHHARRLTVPFNNPRLARAIRPWAKHQKPFEHIRCWSPGVLLLAVDHWPDTPKELMLVHRPTDKQIAKVKWALTRRNTGPIQINTLTDVIRNHLDLAGVRARVDPALTPTREDAAKPQPSQADLRNGWGACDPSHRVVALLSDHAFLVDATQAAAITSLAGASLADGNGKPQTITLVVHPDQLNRQRAQRFLADQSVGHRVVQDTRMRCPWLILQGCDAALALGQDAGGLSLRWALGMGLPTITSTEGPGGEAGGLASDKVQLVLSPSNAHKDLAHALQGVLTGEGCRGDEIVDSREPGQIQTATITP